MVLPRPCSSASKARPCRSSMNATPAGWNGSSSPLNPGNRVPMVEARSFASYSASDSSAQIANRSSSSAKPHDRRCSIALAVGVQVQYFDLVLLWKRRLGRVLTWTTSSGLYENTILILSPSSVARFCTVGATLWVLCLVLRFWISALIIWNS